MDNCVGCNKPRDPKDQLDNAIPDHCGDCSYKIISDKFQAQRVAAQVSNIPDPECHCALCIGAFN